MMMMLLYTDTYNRLEEKFFKIVFCKYKHKHNTLLLPFTEKNNPKDAEWNLQFLNQSQRG